MLRRTSDTTAEFVHRRLHGLAFHFYAAERTHQHFCAEPVARLFAHDNGGMELLVQAFKPRSEIYRIADHRKLDFLSAANIAENYRAGVDADADRDRAFALC